MSSIEPNKLQQALCKLEVRLNRFTQYSHATKKIAGFRLFLEYLKEHQDETYYSIHKIKTISNVNSKDELLSTIEFFSSVLDVEYIYLTYDSEIHISKESYVDTIHNGGTPIELRTGKLMNDFEISKLSFYCTLSHQLLA